MSSLLPLTSITIDPDPIDFIQKGAQTLVMICNKLKNTNTYSMMANFLLSPFKLTLRTKLNIAVSLESI